QRRPHVLVTAGGTSEPIDSVRSLTNFSSGRTGAAIASHLAQDGFDVTLVRARDSARATTPLTEKEFVTFSDLREILRTELGSKDYDGVIHSAAVGDFALDQIEGLNSSGRVAGKIESDGDLVLKLKRNPKLVDELRTFSRKDHLKVI